MADWNLPSLVSLKITVLDQLKARDVSLATMNFSNDDAVPENTIQWNTTNNAWERWNGSAWEPLSSLFSMNVASLDGQRGSYYRNASNINAGTLSAARLPNASTSVKGAVQLSTATTSTSTVRAATSSAIKAVKDLADSKANRSHSHGVDDLPKASTNSLGVVQLSTSTTSNSTTVAATASALNSVRGVAAGKANANHSHNAGDLPNASTTAAGVTRLNAQTSSNSNSEAATPSAVRAVRILAESKANQSHTHGVGDLPTATTSARGLVQLSTNPSGTSESLAATSSAVKYVHDRLNYTNSIVGSLDSRIDTLNTNKANRSELPDRATESREGLARKASLSEMRAGNSVAGFVSPYLVQVKLNETTAPKNHDHDDRYLQLGPAQWTAWTAFTYSSASSARNAAKALINNLNDVVATDEYQVESRTERVTTSSPYGYYSSTYVTRYRARAQYRRILI